MIEIKRGNIFIDGRNYFIVPSLVLDDKILKNYSDQEIEKTIDDYFTLSEKTKKEMIRVIKENRDILLEE